MLRPARAVETEQGRQWAESRIKAITGGDKIAARFTRQDFFEFTPQFKLLIAGNHKPGLRSVDEATRRRLHLIPFGVTISKAERVDVFELLKPEWPGILHWAIQGCLEWQFIGLAPPPVVSDATQKYLAAEDTVAAWLEDKCERVPRHFEKTMKLYTAWKVYAESAGENAGTLKHFRDALGAIGFEDQHTRDGNGFVGLKLKESWQ